MAYYAKVKRALEGASKGVKVTKNEGRLIISKDKKELTKYSLKFIEYSKQNADSFIDYWQYKLKSIR